ncbi:DUF642 domain-containing protein [Pyxidicoccus parkwayensis]|uniref:DUF642 domain-containing protein n=1 Tax=Pyxidicoccus parkwayensis TaxID=2813578 RepID=A0ABX7P0L7_9BACT|nr:DUF642 domain-containing protein [Pyxidicoccus parkwaysis]QSQ24614.1 DUF642 domain-containing protein [Pyxidicoccus parkwaysis]
MNAKRIIRGGAVLVGLVLAGCGGPQTDESAAPELGNTEQGLQLITNTGFEAAPAGSYNYTVLTAGATTLTNWTIGGSIKVMHSTYKAPHAGTKSVDLNGVSAGSIEQTIPTVVGGGYTVKFYVSNSPGCTGVNRTATLTYGPSSASVSNTSAGWSLRTYVFNATSTTSLIKLESTAGGVSCGLAIDDITVDGP